MALLQIQMALLQIHRALLRIHRALLRIYRALLTLSKERAFLVVETCYGVATVSRIDKIIGLFRRMSSLL